MTTEFIALPEELTAEATLTRLRALAPGMAPASEGEPLALARSGFDVRAFQGETFNFIYAENTSTLGIKKFWVWLILPWFALSLTLHGLVNLLEGLRRGE